MARQTRGMATLPPPACELARAQFGAVARRQLLRWMTEGQVEGLVARGTLTTIQRGVYRLTGGATPPEQSPMAAALRARDARVAGPFVLGLFGADGFDTSLPFGVLVRPGRRLVNVDVPVMPDRARNRHDAGWGPLPTVTPTLACLEAARAYWSLDDDRLLTAVDSLRWAGRTSTARLRLLIDSLPDRPGARRLGTAVADGRLVSESPAERRVGLLLERITPFPRRQAVLGGRFRADFRWDELATTLEYDGEIHRVPQQRDHDRRRDLALEAHGELVLRVTREDLGEPEVFLPWLVATLRRRARALAVDVEVTLLPSAEQVSPTPRSSARGGRAS